jgi:Family of unknown function (DUF6370)
MKKKLLVIVFVNFLTFQAQETKNTIIVAAACGQCQFGMKEIRGCDLAVKIGDKFYFVDGTKIDDHGDAHAKNGFCSKVRKANVIGEIVNNRFVASSFIVLPEIIRKKKKLKK